MALATVQEVLERASTDLRFRARYEQDPASVLADYDDLTERERVLLLGYPQAWLDQHRVQPCDRCGAPTQVPRSVAVARCPDCDRNR